MSAFTKKKTNARMARYTGPRRKLERRFGLRENKKFLSGRTVQRGNRQRRKSTYGKQLEEKQKVKFIYGILERQFKRYIEEALRDKKNTGERLLEQLERRLDNVVYRLGFASTRPQARQFVTHGLIQVDGKKVDIPSYRVSPGETISLKPKLATNVHVEETLKEAKDTELPGWLQRKGKVGNVKRAIEKNDLRTDIQTNLIIEYYSR